MSAIYLDPDQMNLTASAISEHAREAEQAVAHLESTCSPEVPPELAAWLAQELADIAATAQMAAVLYLVAALDALTRAEAIRTNQSLVTAAPALAGTGFALGHPGATSYVPLQATGSGFSLAGESFIDPAMAGQGYVLNNVPIYHPSSPGGTTSGPPTSSGSRILDENIMTRRLMNLELRSWTTYNKSMSNSLS
jgi:hypothetical protein